MDRTTQLRSFDPSAHRSVNLPPPGSHRHRDELLEIDRQVHLVVNQGTARHVETDDLGPPAQEFAAMKTIAPETDHLACAHDAIKDHAARAFLESRRVVVAFV